MRIGGHVSIAGGLPQAIERQLAIGGNCGQVFFTGPSAWRASAPLDEEVAAFRAAAITSDIAPWIVHAIYLINLASEDERIWQASIRSLQAYRQLGSRVGVLGIVVHTGSHRGAGLEAVLPRVVAGLEAVLAAQEDGPQVLLEVCAGQGGTIGCAFAELGTIIRALGGDVRLGICLDTCHVFAAGYDVATPDGVQRTLDEFEEEIGIDRLIAIHANDSVHPLGSHRDRHANIGEGCIGDAGFATLLAQPVLRTLPWVLEVPG
ncbi:MAG TPA: deoxyribonuclease IV, partial [Chloroflexota bacterium]|nr:deoxyribonuclease IV [Chloroflexota bacterium]